MSDALGVTCTPLDVIEEPDEERLVQKVVEVARSHDVDELVVGLPRPLAGGTNRQLESVMGFVTNLEVRSKMSVKTWDERFTSKLAGEPRNAKDGPRDSVAACYMLQNYLDACAMARGES